MYNVYGAMIVLYIMYVSLTQVEYTPLYWRIQTWLVGHFPPCKGSPGTPPGTCSADWCRSSGHRRWTHRECWIPELRTSSSPESHRGKDRARTEGTWRHLSARKYHMSLLNKSSIGTYIHVYISHTYMLVPTMHAKAESLHPLSLLEYKFGG